MDNADLVCVIELLKDKAALRELLSPLNPDLHFKVLPRKALRDVAVEDLSLPVILKPAVGFLLHGRLCHREIRRLEPGACRYGGERIRVERALSESVVDASDCIIESLIEGVEYAVDMYYDAEGKARVLNVLRHDFAGPEDTGDRMYVTSRDIVLQVVPLIERWLDDANDYIGAQLPRPCRGSRQDGAVAPIEFNPLRFAGLGGTDVAYLGWGLRTYAAYLQDEAVDFDSMTASAAGKGYSMSLLNPTPSADLRRPFDYEAFEARFSNVLAFHHFDVNVTGSYGFLFLTPMLRALPSSIFCFTAI